MGWRSRPPLTSMNTVAVLANVRRWQSRPLEAVYLTLCFDCLFVKSRQEGMIKNKVVYVALGVNLREEKEFLGVPISETEGAPSFGWRCLPSSNSEASRIVLWSISMGSRACQKPWSRRSPHPGPIVHKVRQSLQYVVWKERRAVAGRHWLRRSTHWSDWPPCGMHIIPRSAPHGGEIGVD